MTEPTPVLVVDADDLSRASTAALLRDYGHAVVEARDGAEGLRLSLQMPPALVILDPWPYLGAAAQLVVSVQDANPGTPVLVVTSQKASSLKGTSRLRGSVRYLEKPCPPARLIGEVARCLEGREPESDFPVPEQPLRPEAGA